MSNILMHIAERALNRPLLITPDKAAVIMSVLSGRIGIDASGLTPDASRFVGDDVGGKRDSEGYLITPPTHKITADGVAIISIVGTLVNRGAYIGASSGVVSYEGFKHQIAAVAADPKARALILDIQSPGGEAIGAFEVAEAVRALAATKRVVAVVNGMAASAAYAIASAANEIVTTDTGVSGSIGVVLMHVDYSEWLKAEGVKPTLVFAGAHKVDGNPFEALPEAVRADLQAEVNAFYDKFVRTVALGRGARMNEAAIRATEARTFIGEQAVKVGLADSVGTFESVLANLSRAPVVGRSTSLSSKGARMSETTGSPAAESAGISKADHDAAVAGARSAGVAEGRASALADVKAITESDEAKGRADAALALALGGIAPDVAKATLAKLPGGGSGHSLAARMENDPVPALGASAAPPAASQPAPLNPAAIYAKRNAKK